MKRRQHNFETVRRPQLRADGLAPACGPVLLSHLFSGFLVTAISCSPLAEARCVPCDSQCPGNLQCDPAIKRCVARIGDSCDLASTLTQGEGGDAGSTSSATAGLASGVTAGSGSVSGATDAGDVGGAAGGDAGTGPGEGSSTNASTGGEIVATTTTTSTATTGPTTLCATPWACDAEITTPSDLGGPLCAGVPFSVQLEAHCACDPDAPHVFTWREGKDLDDVSVTPEGVMAGTLPAGSHEFRATVFADEATTAIPSTLELTVLDRCLVFFASEGDGVNGVHVVGSRLDGAGAFEVPRAGGSDAEVLGFDVSDDGRFLAQVERLETHTTLHLHAVANAGVASLDFEHAGDYLAHAFSDDSRWLALVTTIPTDAEHHLLHLVEIDPTFAEARDETVIDFVDGLTWSAADRILYLGTMEYDPLWTTAQEWEIADGAFHKLIDHWTTADDPAIHPFSGFLVSEGGFFVGYETMPVYHVPPEEYFFPPPMDALSPRLTWAARQGASVARIDPLAADVVAEFPYSTAACDVIRAWSQDESKIMCIRDWAPEIYEVGAADELSSVRIELDAAVDGPTHRATLSRTGRWLAFMPREDVFAVYSLPASGSPLEIAHLEPLSGTNEWDFFFTPSEGAIVVQRGRSLAIAALDATLSRLEFDEVEDVKLPPVPDCAANALPHPEDWCGAAQFRGNLVLSPTESHVGFRDDDGTVTSVHLKASHQALQHGTLASACSRDCIQF